MQRALHYIVSAGLAAGGASLLYFLCLVAGCGNMVFAVPVVLSGIVAIALLARHLAPIETPVTTRSRVSFAILVAGWAVILFRTTEVVEKYGGWDAWAMWNFHARFLRDPRYWTMMFDNGARAHPDYPLFVPSFVAFFSRLFSVPVEPVAYALHLAITLAIPTLIFLRYHTKNLLVASGALFLLVTSRHYVAHGVSMYADTALPFFVLCATISIQTVNDKKWAAFLAAFALGCCAWTKNEGLMLALVFIVLHPRELFSHGRVKFFASGALLPLITLLIFKGVYAPANDMVDGMSGSSWNKLTDASRYRLILSAIREQVPLHFAYMMYALALLFTTCIFARKLPDRRLAFVVIALLGYILTYLLTYLDLEWQLDTSLERLLHQLMPIAVFSIAGTLESVRVPGMTKKHDS